MERTVYPLKHTFIAESSPEYVVINSELSIQKIKERKNPIYPYPKDQEKVPFVREISESSPTKKQVKLYKSDTDYQLRYQFEIIGTCWKLTEYNDDSL